ncbi:MAG: tripartite tricarboxylate transporter substrate binding protein [Alphaproteobacteria bacterium]|nr:tripartite tricarboxylate transporter substrate binding protein [Alphaproteobacteria bacterium]
MFRKLMLSSALLAATAVAALAQTYPNRPIRVVVPFTAGSGTDIVARTVMEQVSQQIGQPIVVENRGGAAGTIGIGSVARAEPDGYTLLIQSTSFAVTATTYTNPGYDHRKDLAGITALVSLPNVLVVAPNKYKDVKALVAHIKANAGKLNYASGGAGSAAHLNGERFRLATGIQIQHLPFKGGPEGLASVMSGDSAFYFIPLPAARGLIDGGRLAALAVSGSMRSGSLPNVPTTIESGFPNSEYDFWVGFWAPAKTPRAIVDRLNAETVKALANPSVKEKLARIGGDPLPMKPADFDKFVNKEIDINATLVKAAGVKIN